MSDDQCPICGEEHGEVDETRPSYLVIPGTPPAQTEGSAGTATVTRITITEPPQTGERQ